VAGSCEHGIEHLDSMKGGELVDWMSDYSFSRRTLLHGVN
jgi:hypothetical protein